LGGFLAVKFIWDVMCQTAPKLKLLLNQLRFGTCFENAFGSHPFVGKAMFQLWGVIFSAP
jgi:hypothetical protein